MFGLTSIKNHDYAREDEALANFKEFGAVGVLVRISDKFMRIKNAMWHKQPFKVAEALRDTLLDLAVYAVILIILVEQEDLAKMEKNPKIKFDSLQRAEQAKIDRIASGLGA